LKHKNDIIRKIASPNEITQAQCEDIIDDFIDEIKKELINGEKISIKGFATFETTDNAPRKRRNPQTGEIEMFKASKRLKCRFSEGLKKAVNGKGD